MNNKTKLQDIAWKVVQKTICGDFVKNGRLNKKMVNEFVEKELNKDESH